LDYVNRLADCLAQGIQKNRAARIGSFGCKYGFRVTQRYLQAAAGIKRRRQFGL
jgi:hypothetical protein